MRALENGRFVIRSTNNGVSAIINNQGKLLASSEQFVQQVLTGQVQAYKGTTPFMRWGSSAALLLCLGLILIAGVYQAKRPERSGH